MSRLSKAYIPFKGYYSTPFCRWQGNLANENAIILGETTANRWFKKRKIELGVYQTGYALMADRCSNGPHTVWANPLGPGGELESENWMMDNFNRDPWAGFKMIQTAENVAKKIGVTKEECDVVTLRRYQQYLDSLANDRAFQKRS